MRLKKKFDSSVRRLKDSTLVGEEGLPTGVCSVIRSQWRHPSSLGPVRLVERNSRYLSVRTRFLWFGVSRCPLVPLGTGVGREGRFLSPEVFTYLVSSGPRWGSLEVEWTGVFYERIVRLRTRGGVLKIQSRYPPRTSVGKTFLRDP